LAEDYWKKPGARPVRLPAATGDSRGYALFDPGSMHGFIAIEQLPAIAAGQSYHLWIVDHASGQVHDAGILPLTGTTRGLYTFALGPSDRPESARPGFFITVEDVDAITRPAKPRGRVVLGSNPI
ncbi:MAG: anti-sigma factor, partial [Lacunisphaera sp.]|nr:anti-sigma factor [Lacunisphaera sp.]